MSLEDVRNHGSALAKNIQKYPLGFLVIVLGAVLCFFIRDNMKLREENTRITSEYLNYLKNIKVELQVIADTSNKIQRYEPK